MDRTLASRRIGLQMLGGAALCALGVPARAAIGGLPSATHGDSSPEWDRLREQIFGKRPIEANPDASAVQLIAPLRAAYGAWVPIKIVSKLPQSGDPYVRKLTLLVDKNPSPVAAMLDLTREVGQADFETRIRVDEYSHVRVVSELSNGQLSMDSRYVKTSGGCSAPPNRDALHLIGKTVLKLPGEPKLDGVNAADVTVVHPNDTGFELNQRTLMYIPAHFVRSIRVTYTGRKIFDADLDFSISENPTWRFNFVPHERGELRAEVTDSKDGHFVGTLAVG
jgi:sulfur-oxidizing protein SoxY